MGLTTSDHPAPTSVPGPARERSRAGRPGVHLLTGVLAATAVLGSVVVGRLPGAPDQAGWATVLALAVYLSAAAALPVEFRTGRHRDLIDMTEVALAPALVLLPPVLLVPLVAVAKVGTQVLGGLPAVKVAFNAAQWAAAAALGSLVLASLRDAGPFTPGDLPALVAALLAVTSLNAIATLVVLSLAERQPLRRVFGAHLGSWLRASAVGLSVAVVFGVLFVTAWMWAPAATPLAVLAILVLHLGARALAAERAGQARLRGLQRAHVLLTAAVDPRPAVPLFLEQLRQAFDCRGATLYAFPAAPAGYRVVRAARHAPDAPMAPAEVDVVAALTRAGPVRWAADGGDRQAEVLRAVGWENCLSAPVTVGDRPAGLLVTHDRGGLEGFESGELAVLQAAASVLGQALHRADLTDAVKAERARLRRSEARWRALVQAAPDLLLVLDHEGCVTYVSPSALRLTGATEQALLGRSVVDLAHPADAPLLSEVLRQVADEPGARRDVPLRLGGRDEDRHLEVVLSNLLDEPAVRGLVLNGRDVTDRRRMESIQAGQALVLERVARGDDLAGTLGLLAKTVESQHDDVWCAVALDRDGLCSLLVEPQLEPDAVAALRAVTGSAIARVDGGDGPVFVDTAGDDRPEAAALLAAGVRRVEVHLLASAESVERPGALVLGYGRCDPHPYDRLISDTAGRLADIAVSTDLARDRLAHQATHDSLTGLPNRAVFMDRLTQAMAQTRRTASLVLVLFLDLDRFKTINDSLGHRAGDTLLRAVGERLGQVLRPGDTVARFGGDEFTMLCAGIRDEAHAVELAERVRGVLRDPFPLAGRDVFVTTSIGLALGGGERPDTLVENADAAMYRAKERGGSCYEIFDEGVRSRATRRLSLHNGLNRALDGLQFEVFYQPTVCLLTGEVLGVEALLRWNHPDEGLLLPSEFVPLAEETGLIVPIGVQVLRDALLQATRWNVESPHRPALTVNVNLSAAQLRDAGLLAHVRQALDETGVDPGQLTLEITESALMADVGASGAVLAQLKQLGLRLVVDDFGTGWSSLAYLQRFPVDGLKIDRSFVAGLGDDGGEEAIVGAVISLARSLGLSAVAEGVETDLQLRRLVDLDCGIAQGYLLGRPMPAQELSRLRRPIPSGATLASGGTSP